MIDDPDYPTYHSLWQKREYLHGANFVARWITHLEPPFKEGSQENDLQPDQDMLQKHIAEANAYLLVYDATNDNSLKELRKIHQVIDGSLQVGDRMKPLIIVANKVDVLAEGEGSTIEEGLAFAKSIDSILVKTSAVDGTGLRDIFVEAVSRIVLEWIATDRHPR